MILVLFDELRGAFPEESPVSLVASPESSIPNEHEHKHDPAEHRTPNTGDP